MTTLSFKHTVPTVSGSTGIVAGLFAAIRREWSYLMAGRALSRLDDAALNDVGVSRGSIEQAVRHGRTAVRSR